MSQKLLDFRSAQIAWVTLVKMENEAFNPIDVGLLGANAVMLHADFAADLVEKFGLTSRISDNSLGCTISC